MLKRCLFNGLLWVVIGCMPGTLLRAEQTAPEPTVKVGGSVESLHESTRTDAEIMFNMLFNEMLSESREVFSIRIYDNNERLMKDYRGGELQAVFIDSVSFLEMESLVHPDLRYTVQYGTTLKQRYMVLVRAKDRIGSLQDLRGKILSTCVGHRIGQRFLDVELMRKGLPEAKDFFREVQILKDVNSAVIDVYFGKSDVALVPEYSYQLALELNSEIGKALKVIGISEPLIYQAVGIRKDFPHDRAMTIETYVLDEKPSRRMQRILNIYHIKRFARLTDEVLMETRALNEEYQRRKVAQ
ncbi:MAG: PhnD/SsuA/transferrin family substrate-binding protein [Candidatus Thiodiazotropha sp.]